jgi:ribosomal-protein-alanine N-acetyltransferase
MKQISEIISMFPIDQGHIKLNHFRLSDIDEQYISWLNDPEVVKYSNQRFRKHSRETCVEYLNSFKSSESIFLSITHKKSEDSIGTMTVYFSSNHQTADIGIMLGNKSYWNQGLGEEAWSTVMEFLLKKAKVRKVTGGTLSCNKGMMRIFEKLDMSLDGVRKDHEVIDGKFFDMFHFAKFE